MLSDAVRGRVRTAKVVVGALMSGVILMAGAAAVVVQQRGGGAMASGDSAASGGAEAGGDAMLITLIVLGAALLVAAYVLIPVIRRKVSSLAFGAALPEGIDPVEKLAPVWLNGVLVSTAMAEAAGLLGGVTYLVTGRPEALTAPAVVVAAMALTFPTEARFRSFVRAVTGRPALEV